MVAKINKTERFAELRRILADNMKAKKMSVKRRSFQMCEAGCGGRSEGLPV